MRKNVIEKKALILIKDTVGFEKLPIQIEKIAEHLNANCNYVGLPDETSGVLEKNQSGRHTILINEAHCEERQRFTIAHELGHLVFSERIGIYVDKRIFFRNGRSQQAIDPDEITANTFAAELLMPSPAIKKSIGTFLRNGFLDTSKDVVSELAGLFKVSTTAMSIKLQNLSLSF